MLFVALATPVLLLSLTRCGFYVTVSVVVLVAMATDVRWWYLGVVMVLGQRVVVEIVRMRRREFEATVSFAFILPVRWRRLVAMDAARAVAMRWWVVTVRRWVVAMHWRSVAMYWWTVAMDRRHAHHVTMSVSLLVTVATMRGWRVKFMTALTTRDTPERGHVPVTWRVDTPLRWLVAMDAPLRWLAAMDRRLETMTTVTRRCFDNVTISVAPRRWRLMENYSFCCHHCCHGCEKDWCQ